MKSVLFFLVFSLGCITLHSFKSSQNIQIQPVEVAVNQLKVDIEQTLTFTKVLAQSFEKKDAEASRKSFLLLKQNFKLHEFFLIHFDYEMYNRYLNGAPLPKIIEKMNELTILEPQGLQIIEEKLFEDEIDFDELKTILVTFEINLNEIFQIIRTKRIEDADVFESMRYGLIYLNSMGIAGFDSPSGPEKTNEENKQFLKGIQYAFSQYKSFLDSNQYSAVDELFQRGIKFFDQNEFNKLDRLTFVKSVLSPLYGQLLISQRELHIEEPTLRGNVQMPLNYGSLSLYADDFFNDDYFLNSIFDGSKKDVVNLGNTLFFDPILSANNQRACASCHNPAKAFTDGNKTSLITGTKEFGVRNSPSILNVIYSTRFFHDVRSDELLTQIDHVVLNKDEFNTDYQTLCNKLSESNDYRDLFKKAFGSDEISTSKLKYAITQFVGSMNSFNSPFDQYIRNETSDYSSSAKRGYNLFTGKATCATCHFAPTFSGLVPPFYVENETEVLGVPMSNKKPYVLDRDLGRFANGIIQEQAIFYKYSFKTPSLRNVELTGPYMHNGVYNTLEEVMDFYNEGGGIGLGMDVPFQTLPADKLNLSKNEIRDIISFMKTLTDTSKVVRGPNKLPKFKNDKLNKRTIGGDY